MVVAAPTGCGKTVIHEIAIMRLLVKLPIKSIKVVYIAPNKALCQQKLDEWTKKFTSFGLRWARIMLDGFCH
jgi:ATP-dependent DNA helicase HFM1/MER3